MRTFFSLSARFVARHPLVVVCLVTAITLGLGAGMTRIRVDTDMTDDIPRTIPEKVFYDQVGEIFPSDDFLIVAVTDSRGVFVPDVLRQVSEWTGAFENLRGVKGVLSISSAGIITGTEEGLSIEEAMPQVPLTPEDATAFRERIEGSDMTAALIGADGKSTAILITLKEGIDSLPLPRVVLRVPEKAPADSPLRERIAALPGVRRVYMPDNAADRTEALVTFLERLEPDTRGRVNILLELEDGTVPETVRDAADTIVRPLGGTASASSAPAPFYDRIEATLTGLEKRSDGKTYISGARAISGIVGRLLITDLSMLFPVVILIIMAVLFLSFRTLRGVFLPLGNVVISVVWAMGLMGVLGQPLSMATMILPIILIAVGTAYTIHVINRYYEELSGTADRIVAIEATISEVALPVFLAGTTTFIGFGSLVLSRIDALRMFGILSALGILFALTLSLTLTPALMALMGTPKAATVSGHHSGRLGRMLGNLGGFVARRPVGVTAVCLAVIGFFAFFAPRVMFETNTINSFRKGSEIREASEYLNANFTGITVMTIIATMEEDGAILEPAVLRAMDGLQGHLESLRLAGRRVVAPEDPAWAGGTPIVGGSQSIVTFIKGINKALNADDPAFDKVPDDITPLPVRTERYVYREGTLLEFDFDTGEYLGSFTEGVDFRLENGAAILDLNGISRSVDLAGGEATDLIPGRIYAGQLVFQYENSGDPRNIEAFLDNPRRTARINVFLKTASSTLIGQVQEHARSHIAENFPPGVDADITGLSNLTLAVLRLLVESQISSVLASLLIVFLFISLMSRSLVEGLFSIIPLCASLTINFGLMGFAGIPIDISTATTATIASIGIGIDYTLHFMERLKATLRTMQFPEAVRETMRTTGKGIFFNALSVAAGFSALIASRLRGNMYMGILMALIMVTSSVFAVTLLPALLALVKPRFLNKGRTATTVH